MNWSRIAHAALALGTGGAVAVEPPHGVAGWAALLGAVLLNLSTLIRGAKP